MTIGAIIGYTVLALFLGFIAFLIIRTISARKPKPPESNYVPNDIDDTVVDNLVEAIKHKTITMPNNDQDGSVFLEYQAFLEKAYPLIMKNSTKYVINKYSVIYAFKGTESDSLLPIAILAHQDVVPAPAKDWGFDPFGGEISEGYIYGRGTQDMKGQMISALDGLEFLLREGKKPARSIYFCFGHDEERAGIYGAYEIVKFLQQRDVRFEFVLDEGGAIIDGKIIGINNKVALVGTCEKGYADVTLEVEKLGGHASTPTRRTAVGLMSQAVYKLEKRKMKPFFSEPVKEMFETLAPYMNPLFKFFIVNRRVFGWLLKRVLTIASPFTNCIVRTTIAPTQLFGATTPNTLPPIAKANVNCRINTGETIDDLTNHIKKVVGKNIKVTVRDGASNPSLVSSPDSPAFKMIGKTVYEVFDGFIMAPYPFIATSDSKYYHVLSDNVYRFTPFEKEESDANRIHGVNERLSVNMLKTATQFFIRLYENTCFDDFSVPKRKSLVSNHLY